jgi:hypothetical protein
VKNTPQVLYDTPQHLSDLIAMNIAKCKQTKTKLRVLWQLEFFWSSKRDVLERESLTSKTPPPSQECYDSNNQETPESKDGKKSLFWKCYFSIYLI